MKIKGIDRVSSKTISEALDIESATIRRDFSYFGELGKKGYGYNVESLLEFFKTEISDSNNIHIAIVGVGNLGRALLTYNFSIHDEMTITAAFDIDKDIVGTKVGKVTVKHIDDISSELQKQGILNFTPARIDVPNDVQVHHIDLGIELQSLLFFMKNSSN